LQEDLRVRMFLMNGIPRRTCGRRV
jgi:hypothetical protein